MSSIKSFQALRQHPRHRVELNVRFRPLGAPAWHEAKAVNLSVGGLCLLCTDRLPAKCVVEILIEVTPNGEKKFHSKTGVVAWFHKGQYGIEFLEV